MSGCPVANLIGRPIGVAVVVLVVLVPLVEPPLVISLELVVEDDTLDVCAALEQPRLGLFVGAIELDVVLQFALAHQARIEGLMVLLVSVSMALEGGCGPPWSGPPQGHGSRDGSSRSGPAREGAADRQNVDRPVDRCGLEDHDWRPLETHQPWTACATRSLVTSTRGRGLERAPARVRAAAERAG